MMSALSNHCCFLNGMPSASWKSRSWWQNTPIIGTPCMTCLNELKLADNSAVLEVGPGESPLLSELAARFKSLTALDNSQEMLNRARQALTRRARRAHDVQFMHGDTRVAREQGLHFDLMIYNMVLHHIPSPQETFAGLRGVVEFGRHTAAHRPESP
jgi:protein-L-isoaspartate O-methyltransferase